MLLAADVGNTQTVLGIFEGEDIAARWRMATEPQRSHDEIGATCASLLALRGMSLADVSAMIVSSDVPQLIRSYRRFAKNLLEVPFLSVSAQLETGLTNRYDDPAAVGSDRIVNAVATGHHYGFPAIVVDFGTATTVEAVDAEANYLGGAIMPGVYLSLDALASRTAKLASVDLEQPLPKAIATNTPDAIRGGYVYGYAGAVDALVRRFMEEMIAEKPVDGVSVVATGGPAPAIVPHCREIQKCDADLTLKGLRVLHEMNA